MSDLVLKESEKYITVTIMAQHLMPLGYTSFLKVNAHRILVGPLSICILVAETFRGRTDYRQLSKAAFHGVATGTFFNDLREKEGERASVLNST